MKPLFPLFALTVILGLGSVTGQQPASTYAFSDITLYHSKNTERFGLFIGEPQSVQWNNGRIELSKAVTVSLNGFVVPRTMAVNGSNTLEIEAQTLQAFEGTANGDQIQIKAKRNLQSVYYFNGTKWFTVTRTLKTGEIAQFKPTPRLSPLGAGLLSSDEAVALSKYLSPKGELLLATLPETEAPDARLIFNPAPSAYRRSVLAIQIGVPQTTTTSTPISNTPAVNANPPKPTNPPPTSSLNATMIKTIGTGSNAAYNQGDGLTRFDETQTDFLETWKMVAGNQLPVPPAPKVDFSKNRIITIFLGQRPTGGYSIRYKSASMLENTLQLVIETFSPSPSSIVTQAITSPYIMLEVKNTEFNAVQVDFIEN
jgi:hypothetical protein